MVTTSKLELDRYIVETLMPDLVGHDRRPSSFLVYLAIVAASADGAAAFSHAELAERTGLSRRAVQIAVGALVKRQLVRATRKGATDIAAYRPLTPWRGGVAAASANRSTNR
jgi:hypothetical protein